MDSLTHIAVGACIGEAFFEKGFGKKAMWWGALAQSLPDIDFISALWMDIPGQLLAHRGFTHSFIFAVLVIPYLSLLANKIHHTQRIRLRTWILFFFSEIFIHLGLDSLNSYGIGWLEPFSQNRFAFHLIFVADPLFSLFPFIAFLCLLFSHAHHTKRLLWWKIGITMPLVYLLICLHIKWHIERLAEKRLASLQIHYSNFHITPAPLQNFLWFVYASNPEGFYTGYINLFQQGKDFNPVYIKRNKVLLEEVKDHESLQKLVRFSKGYYVLEKNNKEIIFKIIRFGQSYGWENSESPFVFSYNLSHDTNSRLNIQRGRTGVLKKKHFISLLRRMFFSS